MDAKNRLAIQDYAVIGDCRAAALVGRNGSIDWLCWPRFDSAAIFSGILDPSGGYWQIAPEVPYRSERRYAHNTNVLETTFMVSGGRAVLTDLFPVASEEYKKKHLVPDHEILRQVECTEGEVEFAMRFCPRSNYGQDRMTIRKNPKLGVRMEGGGGIYWLRSTHEIEVTDGEAVSRVRLHAGDIAQFSLSYAEDAPAVLTCLGTVSDTGERIKISKQWWEQWAAQCEYKGPYREAVVRSALLLKLLTYAPSGAIVASATTSLPELIGGDLNWDYRYCWLRDASLTIRALLALGYWDEAEAFMEWMLHATRLTQPELRILYTVFGENAPRERVLKHLRGYRDSQPVRIGNAARSQLQMDVYGEVVDAAAQFAFHGKPLDRMTQRVLVKIGKYVMRNWRVPDEGIWEPRSGQAHHTHSRLLCWVVLDRLHKLAEDGVIANARESDLAEQREMIRRDILNGAWNERLQSYTSTISGEEFDASLLLLSWYGFEHADSERMRATYRAVRRELGAGDTLLYRYRREPAEGAFGICSFWEAEYLALGGGSLEDARIVFERLLHYANDVGLYAEEIDAASGAALGNFPQAFTHVGLINAAISIQRREEGTKQLPHRAQSSERRNAAEAVTQ
jgi:GH15 family glucan-1,4-alpha-glucosidase